MRIFRHIADVADDYKHAVIAIGNFDGVHLGHQALISRALKRAGGCKAPCAVLCFEPSSREFLRPGAEPIRLTPLRVKAHLIGVLGVDAMFALAFDAELARQTPQDFVKNLLVKGLRVGCVVVGSDFRFGHGRAGDGALLRRMGEAEGFDVEIFPTVMAGTEEKISSTLIRSLLKAGKPEEANRLLGHPFAIEGRVDYGEQRGRALGFPTTNMHLGTFIRPAFGIYAVRVSIIKDDTVVGRHDGVANLGVRPMYLASEPLIETHLFNFEGDLYGMHQSVELISFIRPEAKFASVEELRAQIARDVEAAKAVLARVLPRS